MTDAARAMAYARSLEYGFATPADIMPWLDSLILATEQPSDTLIDAALAGNDRKQMFSLLQVLGAGADPTEVARYRVVDMKTALERGDATEASIALALYRMATFEHVPHPAAVGAMFWFNDALDLAERRIQGEVEEVVAELWAFLEKYGR
jgi:hypothetical protein